MQGIPQISPGQQPTDLPLTASVPVPLVLGEVVRGEVVNILPDAVSMRIKKEIILSKTDVPLRKGETYLLRVKALDEGQVTLEVLQELTSGPAAEMDEIQKTLTRALDNREKLTRDQRAALQTTLEEIPASLREQLPEWGKLIQQLQNTSSPTAAGFLQEAIASSGIFFETKLREWVLKQMGKESLPEAVPETDAGEIARIINEDMKGNLLKLKRLLHDPASETLLKDGKITIETLEDAVDKTLSHIERQQLESKLNGLVQVALPFVWKGLQDGKMLFRESYHPQEGASEYACMIHLDLEGAGRLVARIRVFADRFYLGFIMDNARFKEQLEEHLPLLKKQLADAGMVCDTIRTVHQKKIDFETLTWEQDLDIKV